MLTVWRKVLQPETASDSKKNERRGENDEDFVGGAGLVRSLIFILTPQQYPLVQTAGIGRESRDQSCN